MNLRVIWGVFSSISALQKPSHSYGYVHFLRHDLLENSLPPYPLSTLDLTLVEKSNNRLLALADKMVLEHIVFGMPKYISNNTRHAEYYFLALEYRY